MPREGYALWLWHFRDIFTYMLANSLHKKDFVITRKYISLLTLLLLNTTCLVLANSVDPDQLASEEANWSETTLFVIQYVNLYQ